MLVSIFILIGSIVALVLLISLVETLHNREGNKYIYNHREYKRSTGKTYLVKVSDYNDSFGKTFLAYLVNNLTTLAILIVPSALIGV